jgi:hypothetical protein
MTMEKKNVLSMAEGYLDDGQKKTLRNAMEVASTKNAHMVNPDIRIQCTLRDTFLYVAEKQAKYMFSEDENYRERSKRYGKILEWISENADIIRQE